MMATWNLTRTKLKSHQNEYLWILCHTSSKSDRMNDGWHLWIIYSVLLWYIMLDIDLILRSTIFPTQYLIIVGSCKFLFNLRVSSFSSPKQFSLGPLVCYIVSIGSLLLLSGWWFLWKLGNSLIFFCTTSFFRISLSKLITNRLTMRINYFIFWFTIANCSHGFECKMFTWI